MDKYIENSILLLGGTFLSLIGALMVFGAYPFIVQYPFLSLGTFLIITLLLTPKPKIGKNGWVQKACAGLCTLKSFLGLYTYRWSLTTFTILGMIIFGMTLPILLNGGL